MFFLIESEGTILKPHVRVFCNPFSTAREWVEPTGLYYYRARYYDHRVGRFVAEDPIGYQAGVNFYTYVLNNPINYIDPFGYIYISPSGGGCTSFGGGSLSSAAQSIQSEINDLKQKLKNTKCKCEREKIGDKIRQLFTILRLILQLLCGEDGGGPPPPPPPGGNDQEQVSSGGGNTGLTAHYFNKI